LPHDLAVMHCDKWEDWFMIKEHQPNMTHEFEICDSSSVTDDSLCINVVCMEFNKKILYI